MRALSRLPRFLPVAAPVAAALALALPAVASLDAHARPGTVEQALSLGQLGHWHGVIRDRVMPRSARRLAAARLSRAYGGTYTAHTGERVQVYQSPSLPPDDAGNLALANFLVGLVHGTEISTVVVYLAPYTEVARICGDQSDACYFPSDEQLVVPSDGTPDDTPLAEVIAHEYGHHIANNRSNLPWDAGIWGTKRWSTYEQICTRTANGTAFPGDEGDNYTLNPAEAFAESYRQLNDDRGLTGGTYPWLIVDPSFQPDATAEAVLAQDVTSPWRSSVIASWRGTFSRAGAVVSRTVTPPLDGTVVVRVNAPHGARISVWDGAANLVGASSSSVATTACGRTTYSLRAVGSRRGSYSVTVTQR